ncbi:hypothetical protein DOY81_005300 [Sarcophaga bullata]|nr:hypothetical protein DOY81_005300 [Sarcophaga bullata]
MLRIQDCDKVSQQMIFYTTLLAEHNHNDDDADDDDDDDYDNEDEEMTSTQWQLNELNGILNVMKDEVDPQMPKEDKLQIKLAQWERHSNNTGEFIATKRRKEYFHMYG